MKILRLQTITSELQSIYVEKTNQLHRRQNLFISRVASVPVEPAVYLKHLSYFDMFTFNLKTNSRWGEMNKDAVFHPSKPCSVALYIHKFIRLHFLVFWCSHYPRNVIMGHAPLPSNCNCIYWTVYKLVNNSSAKYRAAIEYIVSWMRRTPQWLTYTRRSCFLQLCRAL